jgi:hypothetical protein
MREMNYEGMCRFVYSAYRHGGTITDVENWMADDLDLPSPALEDVDGRHALHTAFFARYADIDALKENWGRFVASLADRPA